MTFTQAPPQLGNIYRDDSGLRALLQQALPADVVAGCEAELDRLGELGGGELYRLQLDDRLNEPRLVQWDAWGDRIDRVVPTPLWQRAEQVAVHYGLVAEAHEQTYGMHSRLVQFAKIYLFSASTDIFSCPLAMTDGAARALVASGNESLIGRAVPHLTSRDPATFWTSGQWMTEATGGSDVGISETVARRDDAGVWRLHGRKWFTSAVGSQMALTLARPQDNPAGGRGLALFYLETRTADGALNGIRVNRLKDKLGTRKVPTAELELDGARAEPVLGLAEGVKQIAPMLNITRAWNSAVAVALMRRGLVLALDYARRRTAFGTRLIDKPLHIDTLAGAEAECQAALQLTFFVAALIGRTETGQASEQQAQLLRLLTPITKALTGRQAISVLSEVIEAFGGAGYVEDTGLPMLLRDAHVLPIWEGTTNVLALDALRTLREGGLEALRREIGFMFVSIRTPVLVRVSAQVEAAIETVAARLNAAAASGELETDARRIALTLGRCMAAALLARHAQWAADQGLGRGATAAACRFAQHGLSLLIETVPGDARALCGVPPPR